MSITPAATGQYQGSQHHRIEALIAECMMAPEPKPNRLARLVHLPHLHRPHLRRAA